MSPLRRITMIHPHPRRWNWTHESSVCAVIKGHLNRQYETY